MFTSSKWVAASVVAVLSAPGIATAAPAPEPVIVGAVGATAVPDSYIVVLKQSVDVAARAQTLADRHAGKLDRVFDRVLHGFSVTMKNRDALRLAGDPEVAYVVQDQIVSLAGTQPDPPSWGLDRIDQRYLPLDNTYEFPDAAVPATVVVIDSGIRVSHEDFGGRAQHLVDLVDGDSVADDCNGHGTAVAGVIGGAAFGVAKEVQLRAIRVADCAGNATMSRVIDGLDLTAGLPVPKPAVVNLSIEMGCAPLPSCAQPLNQAIRDVVASGYPVVVAAGNNDQDACGVPIAGVVQAITVGATLQNDARRGDSNFGPCVDIWAPGDGIVTVGHASDTATTTFNGTSIAAPHVTGVAAMIMIPR